MSNENTQVQQSQADQRQRAPQRPSAMMVMATRLNTNSDGLLSVLRDTVFKGATDSELMALAIVANEWGLNPLTKEVYAFPAKGGGIVPVISIDGWINRVNSHLQYDGMEKEFVFESNGKPISCTVTIYRRDRSRPTRHTEFLHECHRNTDPWNKQPNRMLGHRAFIQCARLAFGFAGADPDDADMSQARVATGREVTDTPAAGMAAMLAGSAQPREAVAEPTRLPAAEPKKRTASKPETAPVPAENASPSAFSEIHSRLHAFGYSHDEFIAAGRHLGITPARDLAGIGVAEWDASLARWEEVKRAMDEERPAAAGDGEGAE